MVRILKSFILGDNNRSPGVEGNISPLTPSTTPPLPQQQLHPTVVNMEVEGQVRNYNALAMSQNQSTPSIYLTFRHFWGWGVQIYIYRIIL